MPWISVSVCVKFQQQEAEAKAAKRQSPIVRQKEAEAKAAECQSPSVRQEAEAMAAKLQSPSVRYDRRLRPRQRSAVRDTNRERGKEAKELCSYAKVGNF